MKFTHTFDTTTPNGSVICAEIWLDPDTNWGGGYEIWDKATGGHRIDADGHAHSSSSPTWLVSGHSLALPP